MKTIFAQRMALLRQERGLSQRQASAKLGISQALLSHYENGAREPKYEFFLEVCDYYGVTADYLLGRTDERRNCAAILSGKIREIIQSIDELRNTEKAFVSKLTELVKEDYESNAG